MSKEYSRTKKPKSPLDDLNYLFAKKTEPVKHIGPKEAAKEGEESPKTLTEHIIGMAKDKEYNNTGKLSLAEIRFELADKSLQLKDITALLNQYAPQIKTETRPGNIIMLYFKTAHSIKQVYDAQPTAPQLAQAIKNVTNDHGDNTNV